MSSTIVTAPFTFTLNSSLLQPLVQITLLEVLGGVQATVTVLDPNSGDIAGVFFDTANNKLPTNVEGTDVSNDVFTVNNVISVGSSTGNVTMSGAVSTRFDVGVAIEKPGFGVVPSTTFTIQGVTIADLVGANLRWGVRLNSASGGNKLVGTVPPFVTIGDRVFVDRNGDGIQTTGETGLNGVTVQLLNSSGTVVATTTTDTSGNYRFTALAGSYSVKFLAPSGYSFTARTQGSDRALDSDVDPLTGQTAAFTLTAGQTNLNIDAGLFQRVTIGDRVFLDSDADGIQDAGETGLSGVTVKLLNSSNGLVASTTTNSSGDYNFSVTPGTYRLEFGKPNSSYFFSPADQGANDAIDSDVVDSATGRTALVTVTSGQAPNLTVDAGLFQQGTIGDRVFVDTNANGIQDTGEAGLSNVTVKLLDSTGTQVLATTTTNSSGLYNFSTNPGTYQVQFVAPNGYSFSPNNQGSDALDSDADPLTGFTSPITVASGETNNSIDAGLLDVRLRTRLSFDFSSSPFLTERLADQDDVDSDGDGKLEFVNTAFLAPEIGAAFTQNIEITNDGTTIARNTTVAIRGIHPFVQLTGVSGAGSSITGVTTVGDTTTYFITIPTIGAGQTVVLNAISQVINNPTVDLTPTALNYVLKDDPNSTFDFGDATVSGTLYLSALGFNKIAGETEFSFDPFALSQLEVDLGADNTVEASQELNVLRVDSTLTGENGETHRLFTTDAIEGDIDLVASWKGRALSNPAITEQALLWGLDPNITAEEFQALTDSSDFDLLIDAIDQGLGNRRSAVDSLVKDGQPITAQFTATSYAPDGTSLGAFTQAAQAGNLITTDSLVEVTFTGGSFQTFVNALDLNFSYRIILQGVNTIDFARYAGTPTILEIVLPSGQNTLTINNLVDRERLDLRSILVLRSDGQTPANVIVTGDRGRNVQTDNIVGTIGADTINGFNGGDVLNGFLGDDILNGGSGSDILNGGQGDDTLTGGQAQDQFIFDRLFGNDKITDLASNERIDLRALGITSSRLSFSGRTVTVRDSSNVLMGSIEVTNVNSLSLSNFILA